jgi:hypothetical protein
MTPAIIDITIYQGATFRKSFTWLTGDPATPVDLTGATARMQIRKKASELTADVSLTTENGGIVITNAAGGAFEVLITPEQSSAMTNAKGVYDIEIIQGAEVTRLIMGAVTLSFEVTK